MFAIRLSVAGVSPVKNSSIILCFGQLWYSAKPLSHHTLIYIKKKGNEGKIVLKDVNTHGNTIYKTKTKTVQFQ